MTGEKNIGAGTEEVSQSESLRKIVGLFFCHTLKLRDVGDDCVQCLTTGCRGNDIDLVFKI